MEKKEHLVAVLRVRPPLLSQHYTDPSAIIIKDKTLVAKAARGQSTIVYRYDGIFDQLTSTKTLYERQIEPLTNSFLEGVNTTVIAYGMTASGKTHTIFGQQQNPGILPLACKRIMNRILADKRQCLVRCSFIEFYKERIVDLLSTTDKKLTIRQDCHSGIMIDGAVLKPVDTLKGLLKCLNTGLSRRVTGQNTFNNQSSRSHVVFTIYLQVRQCIESTTTYLQAKSHFCDLAGSEQVGKRNASKDSFQQGIKINLSLSALSMVVSALAKNSKPNYRLSQLTRYLKEGLAGNSRTLLIGTISPNPEYINQTLNTLQFTSLARRIKKQVKVNIDGKQALLRQYYLYIEELKAKLQGLSIVEPRFQMTTFEDSLLEIERSILHPSESLRDLKKFKQKLTQKIKVNNHKIQLFQQEYDEFGNQANSAGRIAKQLRYRYQKTQTKINKKLLSHQVQIQPLYNQASALSKELQFYKKIVTKLNLNPNIGMQEGRGIETSLQGPRTQHTSLTTLIPFTSHSQVAPSRMSVRTFRHIK